MAVVRGRPRSSRTGTFLVLAGIAGVLTATFIAGVWTGHNWPVLAGNPRPPVADEPSAGRRPAGEQPRPDTLPALTFYHELTAPLTAPPPPRRPARTARPPALKRAEPDRAESALPSAQTVSAPEAGTRFTIQVAAYTARPLAEALRTTLSAAGHHARVVEAGSGTGVRYRVQVGTFPTREAAREAALRLAAERSLPAFVTTR